MKSVWIKADEGPWEERKPIITFALESGADCVLVSEADIDAVKQLGTITVVTRTSALLEKGVKVTERFHFQARQTKPQTTSGLSHGPLRAPLTSSSQIKLTNSLRKKSRVRATTSSSSEQIGRLSRLKTLLLP
jgi:3-dehydroquinate synthase class II